MEHTKEPWQIRGHFTSLFGLPIVEIETAEGKNIGLTKELDDAKRIVACVNACVGLPTDVLEQTTVKELITMAQPPTPVELENFGMRKT